MIVAGSRHPELATGVAEDIVLQVHDRFRRTKCAKVQQLHLLVLDQLQGEVGALWKIPEGRRFGDRECQHAPVPHLLEPHIGARGRELPATGQSDRSTHFSRP